MERYVGFPARAVAADAGAVFTDHLRFVPGVGSRQTFEKRPRDAPARRDRVPPAPGRRQRRSCAPWPPTTGSRRVDDHRMICKEDWVRRLPRGGGATLIGYRPLRELGAGRRLSQSPVRATAATTIRGVSILTGGRRSPPRSSTSRSRPRASRSGGRGGPPRGCRGTGSHSGRSRSGAAACCSRCAAAGQPLPLVVPGWSVDDLEAVMRTAAGRRPPARPRRPRRPRRPPAGHAEPGGGTRRRRVTGRRNAASDTGDALPDGTAPEDPGPEQAGPVVEDGRDVRVARPAGHRRDARAAAERRA